MANTITQNLAKEVRRTLKWWKSSSAVDWNKLGVKYYQAKGYLKARLCFDKALQLEDKDQRQHQQSNYMLGNIYFLGLDTNQNYVLARIYYTKGFCQN